MNHQDLQLKVVEQTIKKAMNNMSHVMKFKKMTEMMHMSDQGTEGHVTEPPSIHQPLDQGNGDSCKTPCCTASIINQPRDKCLLNKTKTI